MTCRSNFARVLRMSNDLFGGELLPPDAKSKPASRKASTQEPQPMLRPLAERMRPGTLDEVVGQTHLLGAGAPLRTAFEQHRPHSMILWGPPGVGKTTLARLMASAFDLPFISISAVLGGVKEIVFSVEGPDVYSRLKFESGVHRVQRVPETETQGRIHTSTVTVAVMPEAEEVELEINPKDLRIDTFRSSGAGGQHINKTSSAIRVTHLPTGMVVECQDQRSQRENKDRALKVLRSRLLQQKQDAYDEEYNARRQSQVGSGDRSEKIRTYNFPQDRVTDHRIGLTLRNLPGVLDGDLDRVVEPLILADREEKLKQSSTEEGK